MNTNTPPYAGLFSVQGIKYETCTLSREVFCPYCMNPDAALLSGRISFAAIMSGDIVSDPEPFAAFVCPNSHIFLLRQRDVIDVNPAFRNSCTTHSH
jgi:hypothetical protein